MKASAKGGLQYHHKKDEGGIVISGEMLVRYDDGSAVGALTSRICRAGDCFHFPVGAIHQSEALTDCVYIEASTPYFNDRVHCEADYGIDDEAGGLPSTTIEEVEHA